MKIPTLLRDYPKINAKLECQPYEQIKEIFNENFRKDMLLNYTLPLRHESGELFTELCKEFASDKSFSFLSLIIRSAYAKHKEAINIIARTNNRYKVSDNNFSVSINDNLIIFPDSKSFIMANENILRPNCKTCNKVCLTSVYRNEDENYHIVYCEDCHTEAMKQDDCPICLEDKIQVKFMCNHMTCQNCMIEQWKENQFACPICRTVYRGIIYYQTLDQIKFKEYLS